MVHLGVMTFLHESGRPHGHCDGSRQGGAGGPDLRLAGHSCRLVAPTSTRADRAVEPAARLDRDRLAGAASVRGPPPGSHALGGAAYHAPPPDDDDNARTPDEGTISPRCGPASHRSRPCDARSGMQPTPAAASRRRTRRGQEAGSIAREHPPAHRVRCGRLGGFWLIR